MCTFFLDAGNIYQENVCFSPKVVTYVGFLSDMWKDPPRVTVWLAVVGNVLKVLFFNCFGLQERSRSRKVKVLELSGYKNSSRPSPLDRGRARSPQGVPRLPLRQGPSGGALRRSSLDRGRVRSL